MRGEVDCRGRDDRVVIVNELRQCVLEVTRPAPEYAIGVAHLFRQRRVVEDRHHTFAHHAAEKVVQVFDGGRAPSPFPLFDGVARRRNVLDLIEQAEQPVYPIHRSTKLVLERPPEQRLGAVDRLTPQVVLQREAVVVARGLPDDHLLQRLAGTRDRGVLASKFLDRHDRLVTQEAIGIVERIHEGIHRSRRTDEGERHRDMASNPELLALVAERVREQGNDRFRIAHECLSRLRLQRAVTEQRQQRRNEEPVRGAERPRALDGLAGRR